MRKLLLIASVLGTVMSSHAHAAEALRLGMTPEPYMPMTSIDASGTWIGIEAELTNAICAQIAEGCDIKQMSWDALIPSLRENKVDFIVGAFSVTDKRREIVDFSIPYVHATSYVIGSKSDSRKIALAPAKDGAGEVISAAGIEEAIFGVQAASIQANYVAAFLPDIQAQNYNAADNAIADLEAGRVDYVMIDGSFAKGFLASDKGANYEAKLKVPQNKVLGEGVAYAVRKQDEEVLGKVNAAIEKLKADGTLAAILTKWGRE